MDALLESPALRVAGAALATSIAVSALAHCTRRWGKRVSWATTSALVVGAPDAARGDLRFAALVAALASGLAWVLAVEAPLKDLAPATRALALAAGLPTIAILVSVLADLLVANDPPEEPATLRTKAAELAQKAGFTAGQSEAIGSAVRAGERAYEAAAAVATSPGVRACAGAVSGAAIEAGKKVISAALAAVRPKKTAAEVRSEIEQARSEVQEARGRAEDSATREALDSLEETLGGYLSIVDDPAADLERISRAAAEVAVLARRCDEEDGAFAFSVLGLRRDASVEDAKRVYRELARIYHADAHVPGVDPDKFVELTAAYRALRAYFDRKEAA